MNILVLSSNYPSKVSPNYGAFVYNLMQELGKSCQITIITPRKAHSLFKKEQVSYGKEVCTVIRPLYLSIGNKNLRGVDLGKVSEYFFSWSIQNTLKKLPSKPDVIYAHFLSSALPILDYAEKNNIPVIVASGESTYASWEKRREAVKDKFKRVVRHVICVSKENRDQLLKLGFNPRLMTVIPNAVDYDLFRPLDKKVCKENMGLSPDKYTVGFIGHFIHRKGPNRIIEAIRMIEDNDIQLVCVGGRSEELILNNFTTSLAPAPNYQLPEIYNSFDVFVLPTLSEGHCNVIEEAKACGVPIISSKGTSVEEQIDESIGILIDPLNINEIAKAITTLKNNQSLQAEMIANLVALRGQNSLGERASKINKIFKGVVLLGKR